MGEICLSVAPILRCQSLTRLEAGILLLPPGFEIIFAIVLLWTKRGADKKHVLLASEVFFYFFLAILDVITHTVPNVGHSLDMFKALDIFLGVASFLPLFLYTLALYLLTARDLIPSLPARFQKIARYTLLAFIPLILLLNELGSFVGITYRSFGGTNGNPLTLGVGFTNQETEMFLSSVTLVLLTVYQAMNFTVAFYRLMAAFSHQRTLDASQTEKDMKGHLFRGLGWIVGGTKLGAIETVIGFAQGGFGVVFTRRLLRMLGRACLIIGLVKGLDTVEDFQLYSPGQAQRKRKSMLRAMIQNPRFSTFRHVGGHDFEKQHGGAGADPFDDKYTNVIKLGDPSWMRRDYLPPGAAEDIAAQRKSRVSRLTFQLASRVSGGRSKGSHTSARDSGSSFGSTRRHSWSADGHSFVESPQQYVDEWAADADADAQEIDMPAPTRRPAPSSAAVRERVTVYIRQDSLPILQLRRFSNLEFLDLINDPFRDPISRSRSLPLMNSEAAEQPFVPFSAPARGMHAFSMSMSHLPSYRGPPSPVPPLPTGTVAPSVFTRASGSILSRDSGVSFVSPPPRDSAASAVTQEGSFTSYDRPWSVTAPGIAIGSPSIRSDTFDSPVASSPEAFAASRATSSFYAGPDLEAGVADVSLAPSAFRTMGVLSPTETIDSWQSPGSAAGPGFQRRSTTSDGGRHISASTTASEVQALAMQFPGIPGVARSRSSSSRAPSSRPASSRTSSKPSRRSLLSREIVPNDLDASGTDVPVPAMPEPDATRTSFAKRKLAPLRTAGLIDAATADVEIEQGLSDDEDAAIHSLPTPMSAPRYGTAGPPLPRNPRARRADVPVSALNELEEIEEGERSSTGSSELGVVRHASLVRRVVEMPGEGGQQARLVRVKSMGNTSVRSVSQSKRVAKTRDSIKVELGHIAQQGVMGTGMEVPVGAAM